MSGFNDEELAQMNGVLKNFVGRTIKSIKAIEGNLDRIDRVEITFEDNQLLAIEGTVDTGEAAIYIDTGEVEENDN
jgi:hypothetical protein